MSKMPNTANLDHGNDSKPTGKDNKSIEKAKPFEDAKESEHQEDFVSDEDNCSEVFSTPTEEAHAESSLLVKALESQGVSVPPHLKSRTKRTTAGIPASKFSPADFEKKKKESKVPQRSKQKVSDKQILANFGQKNVFSKEENVQLYLFDINANLKRMWNGANLCWANTVLTSILYSFDTIGFQMEKPPTTDRSTWLFEHYLAELQNMKIGSEYDVRLMLKQVIRQYRDVEAGNKFVNNSLLTRQQQSETLLQIFRTEVKGTNRSADPCPWDCLR